MPGRLELDPGMLVYEQRPPLAACLPHDNETLCYRVLDHAFIHFHCVSDLR